MLRPENSSENFLSINHIRTPVPGSFPRGLRHYSDMNLPGLGPSAAEIQHHLYASFLEANTADVALRVQGSWEATYRLHRVVLIQSGFFRSLFTAGFAESWPRLTSHRHGLDEIDIHFDDPNITRAAFEICISRLYGGGPPLHIPPSLIPTTTQPLTPSFPVQQEAPRTPPNHHPATPRFLMSLLATAVYLSIPYLASQALSSILRTVGPYTVVKYLQFALGKPIGPADDLVGEPEAAIGLEHIAHIVEQEKSVASLVAPLQMIQLGEKKIDSDEDLESRKEDPSDPISCSDISSEISYTMDDSVEEWPAKGPSPHYGTLSDKIGEVCACWLARWAADMLAWEEGRVDEKDDTSVYQRKRAKTIPSDTATQSSTTICSPQQHNPTPAIWSYGGLDAKWVAALVSADTLFVRGEKERYQFARSVVELRRKGGCDEVEEKEWVKMFEQGIYYANMSMEEIIAVSEDISPTTKRPFVPLSVLQAAHWTQSLLRHHVTFQPSLSTVSPSSPSSTSSSPTSPHPRDKELGVTFTTADIPAKISAAKHTEKEMYYPVPTDSSLRIGDNGNCPASTTEGMSLSMDQLFTSAHSPTPPEASVKPEISSASNTPILVSNFFGILPAKHAAPSCILSDTTGNRHWSPFPPYRFSVEFWDLESLKEKSRLYSRTVCYAGSLFNVYVQVVRKKGQVQLGIYLHRQSNIDPIPPSSALYQPISRAERLAGPNPGNVSAVGQRQSHLGHNRGPSLPSIFPPSPTPNHYSPSIHPISRSTTPLSHYNASTSPPSSVTGFQSSTGGPQSHAGINAIPATASPVTPPQPYRDPRPSISAHFTISCASATGASQTRFTSAPDVFSISQSWGWKLSSSRTEEFMDVRVEGSSHGSDPGRKEVSLRATIVLGLV